MGGGGVMSVHVYVYAMMIVFCFVVYPQSLKDIQNQLKQLEEERLQGLPVDTAEEIMRYRDKLVSSIEPNADQFPSTN